MGNCSCHLELGPVDPSLPQQCRPPVVRTIDARALRDLGGPRDLSTCYLGDAGGYSEQGLLDVVQRPPGLLPAPDQPPLDRGEPTRVEKALEQCPPLLGVGSQELGKLALWQQRDLAELRQRQAEEQTDELAGLLVSGGQGVPRAVAQLGHADRRVDVDVAEAALLGSLVGRRAGHLKATTPQRDLEDDLRDGVGRGMVAAQRSRRPDARHLAVEGEAHSVEDRGLAGAGGAGEQEQPVSGQRLEVDLLGAGERTERRHRQAVQAHQPTASATRTDSKASRSSDCSAGSAGPRTWATKSVATSVSLRPRTRAA